eukprot:g9224.t1
MEANVTELWQVVEAMQLELDAMSIDMDALWLMLGAILVVFMQAGFAMLEVGSVGAKHTKNLLIKNLLDLSVAAVMWWSFGWGIAFGVESASGSFNQLAGPGSFFSRGSGFEDETGDYGTAEGYTWALWLFQVHTTGGIAALVLVILLGPRLGRFGDKSTTKKMERQSVIMQTLGAFILWVGWYGFNGCSTLYITGSSHTAAKAMACTTICAASAGLGVAATSLILYQHVGPDQVINGILSGLVAITAGCAVVEIEGAFVIGMISALNYLGMSKFLELVHIDDMVDAAAVHLANGLWGVIAAGLFASEEGYSASYYADRSQRCCGYLYGCGPAQLMANAVFVAMILFWSGVTTFLIGLFAKFMGILRISHDVERKGTDSVAHGGIELPEFANQMLASLEALAAKVAYHDERQEGSSTVSPRDRCGSSATPSLRRAPSMRMPRPTARGAGEARDSGLLVAGESLLA